MSQFNLTSKSFTSKPKRGLSLSLEKKKPELKTDNQNQTTQPRPQNLRSCNQSPNSSTRKNRIKFVESYHKNESGSKYEKIRFFKHSDEDIKLGGGKKGSQVSRNQLSYAKNKLFMNDDMSMEQSSIFQPQQQSKLSQFSDRKVLRESRVFSVASNINYFQNVNLGGQKQQGFECSGSKIGGFQGMEMSCKRENGVGMGSGQKAIMRQNENNSTIHKTTEFMGQSAMSKLKQVESNIDQLLHKVTQTRAYLLRCA